MKTYIVICGDLECEVKAKTPQEALVEAYKKERPLMLAQIACVTDMSGAEGELYFDPVPVLRAAKVVE